MIFHKQTYGVRCGVACRARRSCERKGSAQSIYRPYRRSGRSYCDCSITTSGISCRRQLAPESSADSELWRCPRRTGDLAATLRQRRLNNLPPGESELQGSYALTAIPTAGRNCRPPQSGERLASLKRVNLGRIDAAHVMALQIRRDAFVADIERV